MKTVAVSTPINAPADVVYAMVSDLPGKANFSPESQGGEWVSGSPGSVGSVFKGRNAHGKKSWSTKSVVTIAEPGRRFAYDVRAGGGRVATWETVIVPNGSGVVVTETWTDHRKGPLAFLSKFVTGVADRTAENKANMEATMKALGQAATNRR